MRWNSPEPQNTPMVWGLLSTVPICGERGCSKNIKGIWHILCKLAFVDIENQMHLAFNATVVCMDEIFIPFQQNIKALLDSIEDCLSKQRTIPCLILLYSGIDSISALESGKASRSSFKEWVTKYVLKRGSVLSVC